MLNPKKENISGQRIGSGHIVIAARLDWFPVNKELQLENLEITSKLVPLGVAHHKSHLSLKQTQDYGPLWMQSKEVKEVIGEA